MSQEQKLKVSQSRKGKGLGNTNGYKKGQVSPRKGVKVSDESRIKMRIAKLGKVSGKKGKTYNIKFSEQSRTKLSESQLKRRLRENPDYIPYQWMDLRKKRLKQAGGFHSQGEWETLKAQFNWTCPNCNLKEPFLNQHTKTLTKDHIIPASRGGSDNIENIQPLCRKCNSKKYNKTIKY